MTFHLLTGGILLAALAAILLGQVAREPVAKPAVAVAKQHSLPAGSDVAGVFGRGPALRNLIF